MTAPERPRYPLDGYRAVAVLGVLGYHCYQHNRTGPGERWPLGDTPWHVAFASVPAVEMFFVLSGFLVGLPYARAALGDGTLRPWRTVVRRRFARLVPLYWTIVLVVWCVTNPSLPGDWRDLVLHLSFTQVHTDGWIFTTVGPAWTLALEVHYFVLVVVLGPLAVRGARRAAARWRAMLLVTFVLPLLVTSWVFRFWAGEIADLPWQRWSVWFSPLAHLDTFAVGVLLAIVAAGGVRLRAGAPQRLVALAGVALIGLAMVLVVLDDMRGWYLHTVTAAGCALVLASTSFAPTAPRWLTWRGTALLTALAYGLYLWQEPVLRALAALGLLPAPAPGLTFLVTFAVLLPVTAAVAWAGLHLVELPLARLFELWAANGRSAHVQDPHGSDDPTDPQLRDPRRHLHAVPDRP